MGRRLISTMAALAIGVVGALAFAAPGSASTQHKLWEVTASESDCTGNITVTLANNTKSEKFDGVGLVFTVNGDAVAVDPGESEAVTFAYPESQSITVDLTGGYTLPEVESVERVAPQTHWEFGWKRPAGCFEIADVSHCNNTFTITVKNTAPTSATIGVQVNGSEAISQVIPGNATLPLTYNKDKSVVLLIEENAQQPITWVKPDCTTPAPTTAPPTTTEPPLAAPGSLPVTGASATLPLSSGAAILVLAGALWGFLAWRRRKADAQA